MLDGVSRTLQGGFLHLCSQGRGLLGDPGGKLFQPVELQLMSMLWRPHSSLLSPSWRCHSFAHDLLASQPPRKRGGAAESDFVWAPCHAALRFTTCPHFIEKETETPRSSREARI